MVGQTSHVSGARNARRDAAREMGMMGRFPMTLPPPIRSMTERRCGRQRPRPPGPLAGVVAKLPATNVPRNTQRGILRARVTQESPLRPDDQLWTAVRPGRDQLGRSCARTLALPETSSSSRRRTLTTCGRAVRRRGARGKYCSPARPEHWGDGGAGLRRHFNRHRFDPSPARGDDGGPGSGLAVRTGAVRRDSSTPRSGQPKRCILRWKACRCLSTGVVLDAQPLDQGGARHVEEVGAANSVLPSSPGCSGQDSTGHPEGRGASRDIS